MAPPESFDFASYRLAILVYDLSSLLKLIKLAMCQAASRFFCSSATQLKQYRS